MNAHSQYSPSGSYIWLNCLKSIKHIKELPPDKGNAASDLGTLKHEIIEKYLKDYPLHWMVHTTYKDFLRNMRVSQRIIKGGVCLSEKGNESINLFNALKNFVLSLDLPKNYKCWQETKLNMDNLIKGCYGTADVIIKLKDSVYVLDWKFGRGAVSADSTQLLIYLFGLYKKYPKMDLYHAVIIQPNGSKNYKMVTYTNLEIERLLKEYKAKLRKLKKENKHKIGDWCLKWARCRSVCPAKKKRQEAIFKKAMSL